MNAEMLRLLGALLFMVLATLMHEPMWLALGLLAWLILAGRECLCLLRQTLFAVLAVGGVISLGMLIAGWLNGSVDWRFLLLLNMRVLLLSFVAAWIGRRVDFNRALERWPVLCRGLAVVRVQAAGLRRLRDDYDAGFRSRCADTPSMMSRYRAVSAHGLGLLDKAVANADAVTQAMRSRGAFDD